MNRQSYDVLLAIQAHPGYSQRLLAQACGHSLGIVNRCIRELTAHSYLSPEGVPTQKARALLQQTKPKNAIILAAGFGMRMVPINTELPKALLEVHGETLIERLIRQLHEAGIHRIHIVVGFMKERFEYLIDAYGVNLIVNPEYNTKNNLHSLFLASQHLCNSYIIPCDIWCRKNPFRQQELYSWYMVSNTVDRDSTVRVNRACELVAATPNAPGNHMIGIGYLTGSEAERLGQRLTREHSNPAYRDAFWEDLLWENNKLFLPGRVVPEDRVVEINTYEQLRVLDKGSDQLKSDVIETICRALGVQAHEITEITVLKKGMTNRSFLFSCGNKRYIMRVPGEGTDRLINRGQEACVYHTVSSHRLCDDIVYINPENGYKITEYIEGARVCDPENPEDLQRCMAVLRAFHEKKLQVGHTFDLFGQIDFYESLWNGMPSIYPDYGITKANVLSLKPYIDAYANPFVLTHIDAVPDNFLFTAQGDIRLIDWEYAGMQDPHVDIAMFCIYALYDKSQTDGLIDLYFSEGCPTQIRLKLYCYMAVCGLLWSNWCEYKRHLGVEFGEYSLRQYRYAKEFYRHAKALAERS